MRQKRCSKCQAKKPLSAFAKKSGKLQLYCRECNRAYSRAYYAQDKAKQCARVQRRREYLRSRFFAVRAASKCADCGEADPVVLDFDHRPSEEKLTEVTVLVHNGYSWAVIAREIAKCDVVCANCHRRRTASRIAR